MKKVLILSILLLSSAAANSAVITGFGNTADFAVDSGTSNFTTITPGANSIQVIGNDTQILAGTFNPVDITGLGTIRLTASITTVVASQFTVDLYNTTFTETKSYSGFFNSFGASPTVVDLTFVTQSAPFNDIAAFQFTGAGSGTAVNMTFDSLEAVAVPEPTSAVLLLSGAAMFFLRRRRA